jgi:3-hydroxyisobutyrate dehydrogenase
MSKISVLGLGAMGSRMAAHLVKAGHDVTVWNRTADATKPLIAAGATQAQTPGEAAACAAFVVAMVRDDEAATQRRWYSPQRCDSDCSFRGGQNSGGQEDAKPPDKPTREIEPGS